LELAGAERRSIVQRDLHLRGSTASERQNVPQEKRSDEKKKKKSPAFAERRGNSKGGVLFRRESTSLKQWELWHKRKEAFTKGRAEAVHLNT